MKVLIVNDEAQDDLIGRLKDAGFDGCILAASSSASSNLMMVEVGADEVCDFDRLPAQLARLTQ